MKLAQINKRMVRNPTEKGMSYTDDEVSECIADFSPEVRRAGTGTNTCFRCGGKWHFAPARVVACVVELATTNQPVLPNHHRRPTLRLDSSVMATPTSPMMAAPLELKTVCSSKVAARSTRADMEERGEDTPINAP